MTTILSVVNNLKANNNTLAEAKESLATILKGQAFDRETIEQVKQAKTKKALYALLDQGTNEQQTENIDDLLKAFEPVKPKPLDYDGDELNARNLSVFARQSISFEEGADRQKQTLTTLRDKALAFVAQYYDKKEGYNNLQVLAEDLTDTIQVLMDNGTFGSLEAWVQPKKMGAKPTMKQATKNSQSMVRYIVRAVEAVTGKEYTLKGSTKIRAELVTAKVVKPLLDRVVATIDKEKEFAALQGLDGEAVKAIADALESFKERKAAEQEAKQQEIARREENESLRIQARKLADLVVSLQESGFDATAQIEKLKELRQKVVGEI